jgi:hypothetical protein
MLGTQNNGGPPAAKGRNMNLNEHRTITSAPQFPAKNISSSDSRPLRGALVHASQVKLLLRRASQETGFQRAECLARLLQGVERICTSLEWLTSGEPQAAKCVEHVHQHCEPAEAAL